MGLDMLLVWFAKYKVHIGWILVPVLIYAVGMVVKNMDQKEDDLGR